MAQPWRASKTGRGSFADVARKTCHRRQATVQILRQHRERQASDPDERLRTWRERHADEREGHEGHTNENEEPERSLPFPEAPKCHEPAMRRHQSPGT